MEEFPKFKYHPDPLATGSVTESANRCKACKRKRGFIYAGPVYAVDDLDGSICPWCVADGSAASKFEATYVDPSGICPDVPVPEAVVEEIGLRTPGFAGWQQEVWLGCCDDGAAFLGPMGRSELERLGPKAIEAVRDQAGLHGQEWEAYFNALNRDNGPTAYVFQCLHCSALLAYSDSA